MLSSFRERKAVCVALRTAHDILNNALIPGVTLGKPAVNRCYVRPFTARREVSGLRFVTLPNDDTLSKPGTMFSPNFVANRSGNHKHDFLVTILTVRYCGKAFVAVDRCTVA